MKEPPRKAGIENRRHRGHDGTITWTFRIRWVDPASGARRSEEFNDQRTAIDFKAKLRLARRGGQLERLTAGRVRLRDFVEQEWWPTYAAVELERSTLKTYASVWNKHALPRIGYYELRQFDAAVVAQFRRSLEEDGVGAATIRKTMSVLQSIFTQAVLWRRVDGNPFDAVRKPRVRRTAVRQLPPEVVEAILAGIPDLPSRTLAALIAYAGLRPEEALALEWRHIRRRTLLIEQKNVDGRIANWQKVAGKPPRSVDLLKPLAQDLAALRLASPSSQNRLRLRDADRRAVERHAVPQLAQPAMATGRRRRRCRHAGEGEGQREAPAQIRRTAPLRPAPLVRKPAPARRPAVTGRDRRTARALNSDAVQRLRARHRGAEGRAERRRRTAHPRGSRESRLTRTRKKNAPKTPQKPPGARRDEDRPLEIPRPA